MNPNGILFGPNARLDLSGSFHATTADTIRLVDGGEFNARTPAKSLLTVPRPEAFGFLGDTPAPVEIQGSRLEVSSGQTLSVVAGDVTANDAILFAPEGQIQLASVASSGDVISSQSGLQLTHFGKLGNIKISQLPPEEETEASDMPANLDVSGNGSGQIFTRGGQFTTQGALVFSDTHGSEEGTGIDIDITGDINLSGGGGITADSLSSGKGGNISITATGSISMQSQLDATTTIATNAFAKGDAGEIRIKASQLEMTSSQISSSPKEAGTIGQGGNIFIEVGKLVLKDAAHIQGITFGAGKGGNIDIHADSILMSADPSFYEWGQANFGVPLSSSISVSVEPDATGAGGTISIMANHLELQGNAFIISQTLGQGKGGDLVINVRDDFTLFDNSGITRSGLSSLSDKKGADAGNITVKAGRLIIDEGGFINSRAYQPSASGGNIDLTVKENLFLFNSTITAEAQGDQEGDDGGNLAITGPHLFLMDTHSQLFAKAKAGHGGNIRIVADNFLNCAPLTAINASSEKGIDGEVTIDAIQIDLTGLLNQSLHPYLHLTPMSRLQCGMRGGRKPDRESRFKIQMQEMLRPVPSDLRFFSPAEY